MICNQCGNQTTVGMAFCENCGSALRSAAPQPNRSGEGQIGFQNQPPAPQTQGTAMRGVDMANKVNKEKKDGGKNLIRVAGVCLALFGGYWIVTSWSEMFQQLSYVEGTDLLLTWVWIIEPLLEVAFGVYGTIIAGKTEKARNCIAMGIALCVAGVISIFGWSILDGSVFDAISYMMRDGFFLLATIATFLFPILYIVGGNMNKSGR